MRTAAIYVQAPGGRGRSHGDEEKSGATPLRGSQREIAAELLRFADIGLAQVQLVVDPITTESVKWCGGIIEALDH